MVRQLHLDVSLRDDATFDNYVGRASSIILHTSGSLYVWGSPGSGRSHLLQALCHYHDNAIYLENLNQHQPDILKGLENIDIICVDDVHKVIGNREWEESLFHLINATKDQGKQLVFSSVEPAASLPVRLADLHSRLIAATAIETDSLDDDQKLDVLITRAHNRGFRLSSEVGRFILSRCSRDMSALLVLLKKLEDETLSQGKTVSIPFVKQTLKL